MVALSFNSQQYTPQYGGGGQQLPAGPNGENVKYNVMIVSSTPVDTKDQYGQTKGAYLAFELASLDGPTQGQKQTDRLNLFHSDPKTVQIANQQLSAYCHVVGKFNIQQTEELHNIPFVVEIGLQRDKQSNPHEKGYTEVKAIFDRNGNPPGKAGAGPQVNQQQQPNIPNEPAGNVTAQGNGWNGNQGQPNGNNGQPNQGGYAIDNNVQQPQGNQGNQGNPNGGNGWGGPANGGNGQPQGDPNAGQPNGGGWGANQGGGAGQPQGQPNGGNPGWGGNQPQGGGNPGWGGAR